MQVNYATVGLAAMKFDKGVAANIMAMTAMTTAMTMIFHFALSCPRR